MVETYIDILGLNDTIKLLESHKKRVKPIVRVNTLLIKPSELEKRLRELGFELTPIPWSSRSYWITKHPISPTIGATHEYLKGYYYVHRDATSLIPVYLLIHEYIGDVLDACAAPGGKSTYLAQLLKENQGNNIVYANDLVLYRLKSLIGHTMRMKLDNIVVLWSDARKLREILARKFHRILLDAPCSGEGRISIDPGRKTRTSLLDLAIMVKREIELLYSLIDLLEPGGILIYVTCSTLPQENEYVVNNVLKYKGDIEVVESPIKLFNYSKGITEYGNLKFEIQLENCIRIWPHLHELFGYTICLLEKKR